MRSPSSHRTRVPPSRRPRRADRSQHRQLRLTTGPSISVRQHAIHAARTRGSRWCCQDTSLCALFAQLLSELRLRVNRAAGGECVDGCRSTTAPPVARRSEGQKFSRAATIRRPRSACAIVDQIIAEVDDAQAENWQRGHRLARIDAQNFPLLGTFGCSASPTAGRWRRCGPNSPPTPACARCSRTSAMAAGSEIRAGAERRRSAQYAIATARPPQAHALAHGSNVTVAVDRFRH